MSEPAVLRAVRRAARRREDGDERFRVAVRKAVEAGFSSRRVAECAGVSYATVQRIAKEDGSDGG